MPTTERPPQDGPIDVTLRPATPDDAATMARLFRSVRLSAVPFIPPPVHTEAEDLALFGGLLGDGLHDGWLAEVAGEVVGLAVATPTWLDHLYVHPCHQGVGIGSALIGLVQSRRPAGFGLWVFESNAPARAFYAARGLVEVERTDGSENEEKAPDIRLEWTAPV